MEADPCKWNARKVQSDHLAWTWLWHALTFLCFQGWKRSASLQQYTSGITRQEHAKTVFEFQTIVTVAEAYYAPSFPYSDSASDQKRSMMKSPASSAAPAIHSPASSAAPATASPTSSAAPAMGINQTKHTECWTTESEFSNTFKQHPYFHDSHPKCTALQIWQDFCSPFSSLRLKLPLLRQLRHHQVLPWWHPNPLLQCAHQGQHLQLQDRPLPLPQLFQQPPSLQYSNHLFFSLLLLQEQQELVLRVWAQMVLVHRALEWANLHPWELGPTWPHQPWPWLAHSRQ